MDGPREHYAKLNKPVRERQIVYDFTYMWNLMNKIETETHRDRKQTESCLRGGGLGVR